MKRPRLWGILWGRGIWTTSSGEYDVPLYKPIIRYVNVVQNVWVVKFCWTQYCTQLLKLLVMPYIWRNGDVRFYTWERVIIFNLNDSKAFSCTVPRCSELLHRTKVGKVLIMTEQEICFYANVHKSWNTKPNTCTDLIDSVLKSSIFLAVPQNLKETNLQQVALQWQFLPMLEGIPVLSAVCSFTTDDTPMLELGDVREYQKEGLVLLKKLVIFTQDEVNFPIANEQLEELLGLVRLADYLGVDDFLQLTGS